MNVVISRLLLAQLIGKIQNIIPNKPPIPILCNLLLEAIDDQLIVSATDLTVSMRLFAEAKVIEEGSITLPARSFFQLIRELTVPQIKICTSGSEVAEITAGTSFFKIHGMRITEFPQIADLSNSPHFSLPSEKLKELILRTSFSAGTDDSRYIFNGVHLHICERIATFTATDGKRLAKISIPIEIDPTFQGSYVFPLKAVEEMAKMLDDSSEEASISLMPDKASLEFKELTLFTKLLAGQYPDIDAVIPKQSKISIPLHREELIALLRQVSLFTSDMSSPIRFHFTPGELKLHGASAELGEGSVVMPVNYDKEPFEVAFNPYYFLNILKHSKDETVTFSINDSFNPGLITDSTSALFVIMPMRTHDNVPEKPVFA